MPKISVVVPVYGVEKFIKQCLDSILSQTLTDIEIILVDDGSKDNCPQIIDEYAKNDPRVVAIHQPNGGYGRAVNHGIEVATGEYIGIVEPDDWIEPDMYEVLYNKAVESGADFVKSNFFRYKGDTDINTMHHLLPDEIYDKTLIPSEHVSTLAIAPCIWSSVYKKDFLSKNDIKLLETPGASYQDTGFHFKNFLASQKVHFVNRAFYHYRIDNAASSVKDKRKIFCICDEWEEIIRWAKERKIYDKFSGLLCMLQYNTYMWNWKRLSGDIKSQFLQRFSDDFKVYYQGGFIKKEYFSAKNYKRLQQIIFHPKKFDFFYKLKHFPKVILKKLRVK